MIDTLLNAKTNWMRSHVDDAQYPTKASQRGLNHYLAIERTASLMTTELEVEPLDIHLYWVDCHPLMVRYAQILSSAWSEEATKADVIEYLTQFIFEENSPAQCAVGFYKGKPVVCGQSFQQGNQAIISDVVALPSTLQLSLQTAFLKQLRDQLPQNIETYVECTDGNFQ